MNFSFRHFFAHRFHPDIIEHVLETYNIIEDAVDEAVELEGDLAGAVVAAASAFYNNVCVSVF